jgi:phage protein U
VYTHGMDEQPTKRGPGRPATGRTPLRTIRAGAVWDRGAALAEGRGETMTDFVVRAIEREIARVEREAARADKDSKES